MFGRERFDDFACCVEDSEGERAFGLRECDDDFQRWLRSPFGGFRGVGSVRWQQCETQRAGDESRHEGVR